MEVQLVVVNFSFLLFLLFIFLRGESRVGSSFGFGFFLMKMIWKVMEILSQAKSMAHVVEDSHDNNKEV